jgi:hypothetical protein
MSPRAGMLLRLGGMLIELICASLFMASRGRGRTVAGLPVEYLLFAAFAVGLVMWLAGVTLTRRAWPARRPPRD